jgi:hypothetical protein
MDPSLPGYPGSFFIILSFHVIKYVGIFLNEKKNPVSTNAVPKVHFTREKNPDI